VNDLSGARGALQGVRVVDVSRMVSGPLSTFWLANLGAEVLAVERVGNDVQRGLAPFASPAGGLVDTPVEGGLSVPYLKRHRGKRSVVIAYDTPAGAALLRSLVARADVFVENARPGLMARLGLGWSDLRAVNPRLVYVSVSGFGQEGPDAARPAMDHVVQARSGLMAKTGFPEGPPTRAGSTVGDFLGATFAAMGVLAALRQRDATGLGDHVDVAMLEALSALVWDEPVDHYAATGRPVRTGNADPRGAGIDAYECRDGWIAMCMAGEQQWERLAVLLDRPEWNTEWAGARSRAEHRDEIDAALRSWAEARGAADAEAQLLSIGVPVSVVREPAETATDPQLAFREFLTPLRHPSAPPEAPSGLLGHRLPIAFAGRVDELPPTEPPGASTDAVLREWLGLDAQALADLRHSGTTA
jgi:crotonobetainyl-CoA:carnitine CoA-transferase CaiB-like acyl-CoA transferase